MHQKIQIIIDNNNDNKKILKEQTKQGLDQVRVGQFKTGQGRTASCSLGLSGLGETS